MDGEHPLEFYSVTASRDGDTVDVRVEGRWRSRERLSVERAMLVVEANDQRHRFPAIPQPRRMRIGRPAVWSGNFAVPTWLEPRLEGNTSLRLGDVSIPLPPGSFSDLQADLPDASEPGVSEPDASEPGVSEPDASEPGVSEPDASEPGIEAEPELEPAVARVPWLQADARLDPPADVPPETSTGSDPGPTETVAALRAELERRAAGEASVRGQLTQARAELEAQAANQSRLEATHAELRRELEGLHEAVQANREQLDGELANLRVALANSEVSREAAQSEVAGLRAELDRLGAELAAARQQGGGGRSEVDEAEALLAEARALRARMNERATTTGQP